MLASVLLGKTVWGFVFCFPPQKKNSWQLKTTSIDHFVGIGSWMFRDFTSFLRDLKPEFG